MTVKTCANCGDRHNSQKSPYCGYCRETLYQKPNKIEDLPLSVNESIDGTTGDRISFACDGRWELK